MEEKDKEQRRMVGEQQDLEFGSKERIRKAVMLEGERKRNRRIEK